MRSAPVVALCLVLAACGDGDRSTSVDDVPPVADEAPTTPLPTPEAAPGSSVTGMPTQPPPPRPAAEPAATAAPADVSAPLPTPVDPADPNASLPLPVDGTTPADPAASAPPPAAVDTAPATSIVTQYMAAVSSGALTSAQGLWSTTPNDSAVMQLARGEAFSVSVGAAAADTGGRVMVPVDVRGRAEDGSDRHLQVAYAVQRTATGTWRIVSATVRDAAP